MQESGEMYLETILLLSKRIGTVRSIDIAEEMNFSRPSVSRAVSVLKKGGFITVDPQGSIELTEEGAKTATRIYARHQVLTAFLSRIGVPQDIAAEDACRMEHYISDTTFEAIKAHVEKL